MAAFIFIESRAAEPIIPLDLFKNSIFTVSVGTVFVTGVGLFGAVLFIPLFIQAIQGDSATCAVIRAELTDKIRLRLGDSLLAKGGQYASLWRLQTGEAPPPLGLATAVAS